LNFAKVTFNTQVFEGNLKKYYKNRLRLIS